MALPVSPARSAEPGRFQGKAVVEWLDDAFVPSMRVVQAFGFRQADGPLWQVPPGQVLSESGMPPLFRDLTELRDSGGQLFDSSFRQSALVYVSAVQSMSKPWDAAQRMFLEACVTEGVPVPEAKAMYALLAAQGSRWEVPGSRCFGSCHGLTQPLTWRPVVDETRVRDMMKWVRAKDPTLAEIDARARTAINATGPHIFPQPECSRVLGATATRGGCN